jgi:hypothetical protein
MPDADLSLAVPAVFFGAIGTAGQRCTSTRRLFLHRQIANDFLDRLKELYSSVHVGDPLDETTLLGPLHSSSGVDVYTNAVDSLRSADAEILIGGKRYENETLRKGHFVQPTIALPKSVDQSNPIWSTETFAPILNAAVFEELEQAIEWNNAVPQGLSSSLWTRDIRNVGRWIGPSGSDTGIVNVRLHSCLYFFCRTDEIWKGQCGHEWRRNWSSIWGQQGEEFFFVDVATSEAMLTRLQSTGWSVKGLRFAFFAFINLVAIGAANPVETLGSSMYDGAQRRSTSRMLPPWLKGLDLVPEGGVGLHCHNARSHQNVNRMTPFSSNLGDRGLRPAAG